jgi:6-pyruvoyl-tetrahydropterin synthase related domain
LQRALIFPFPAMRLSDALFKLVLMALAFVAASLLLRDASVIGAHVPLDPNEGWNAYLDRAAISGGSLYPQGLMINNYPPLSFYIIGALSTITGDPIVAGRLVSMIAFIAVAGGIIVCLREMGADVLASLFGCLFFAASLLIASDYVAMNDPQLLGHALQLAGLSLLMQSRRHVLAAALLMAVALFVKHSLLALPLATMAWLWRRDRADGARFTIALLILCFAGLALTRFFLDANLLTTLASPRRWTFVNFLSGAQHFSSWAGIAVIATALMAWRRPRDEAVILVALYAGAALLLGGLFSFGDGVDANIYFDASIALGLSVGLVLLHLPTRWTGIAALGLAAPLALCLSQTYSAMNFPYTEIFAREMPRDIAFLKLHPGPAICENLTLCYWADKDDPVDVFNLSEAFKTHARNDADLIGLIDKKHFGSVVVDSMNDFAFGPDVKAALLAHYRVSRDDDNGIFLEPRN